MTSQIIKAITAFIAAWFIVAGVGCGGVRSAVDAEAVPDSILASPLPRIQVPHAENPPAINAEPADSSWTRAAVIDHLALSVGPQGRGLEPVPTQVRLLWDADFLYIRFVCEDRHVFVPHGAQRDAHHHEGDVVEVFLDPVGDGRQWYEIQVNPEGGVFDILTVLTGEPTSVAAGFLDQRARRQTWVFPEYDVAGLRTASQCIASGWIVDIAIPASVVCKRLETNAIEPMTLRGNFLRYDYPLNPAGERRLVAMNWSPLAWGNPHRSPRRMGSIHLVETDTSQKQER